MSFLAGAGHKTWTRKEIHLNESLPRIADQKVTIILSTIACVGRLPHYSN